MKIRQLIPIGTVAFALLLSCCINASSSYQLQKADLDAAAEKLGTALLTSQSLSSFLNAHARNATAKQEKTMTQRERRMSQRPLLITSGIENKTGENIDMFENAAARIVKILFDSHKVRVSANELKKLQPASADQAPSVQKRTVIRREPIPIPDLALRCIFLARKPASGQKSYEMVIYLTDTNTGNLIYTNAVEFPERPKKQTKDNSPDGICMFLSTNLIQNLFGSPDFESYCRNFAANSKKGMTGREMRDQRPVLMFSGIENQTGENVGIFDAATARILQVFTSSGKVRVSAVRGHGSHIDGSISDIWRLSSLERKSSRQRKRRAIPPANLSLSGVLLKKPSKQTGTVSYIMTLILTDNESGNAVWARRQELQLQKR